MISWELQAHKFPVRSVFIKAVRISFSRSLLLLYRLLTEVLQRCPLSIEIAIEAIAHKKKYITVSLQEDTIEESTTLFNYRRTLEEEEESF